jgi:hypothetical protein
MVKRTEEVARALIDCHGAPLTVGVPGSAPRFVLVEQSTLRPLDVRNP